jgi:hypothetical protein
VRTALALLLVLSACESADDSDVRCVAFCGDLARCGLLPSDIGEDEDNCAARCRLTDSDVAEDLIPQWDSRDTGTDGEPACSDQSTPLFGWCDGSVPAFCRDLAGHVREVLGDPVATGEASVTVRVVASPASNGECRSPASASDDASAGPCEPDLPCQSGAQAAVPAASDASDDGVCLYRPVRGLDVDGPGPSFATALGIMEARVRLEPSETWRPLDPLTLSRDFQDVLPGPVQAAIELRGEYPRTDPLATPAAMQQLDAPSGGLVGPYCFVFRSAATRVTAGSTTSVDVLMPPTAAHVVARGWSQADATAHRASPVLFSCEYDLDACRNGHDDDGDGQSDCGDVDCASWCADAEKSGACTDGADNDGDGAIDCADPGCAAICETTSAQCRNGADDDADGAVDCADDGCAKVCTARPRPCDEGQVCPLRTGAAMPSCDACTSSGCAWSCAVEPDVLCDNALDDDGDGLTDCADPDCGGPGATVICPETTAVACSDGRDNDGNAAVDCLDAACADWCSASDDPQ